jgi:hypothetical protein
LRTWRIRPKKRGRRPLRIDDRLVGRVLLDQRSLTQIARRRRLTRQAISHRFLRALQARFECSPAAKTLGSDFILLADGLWFRFKGRPWVLYLMALRPIEAAEATFVDPLLIEGPERKQAWQRAMETLSSDRRLKIRALVGDKFTGCRSIAEENGWVLQLCHFHLLAQLKARLGKRPSFKARMLRSEAYRLVKRALTTIDGKELSWIIYCLRALITEAAMPVAYRRAVKGFLRHMDHYHAYLAYPNLRLPRTNNSAEAMGRRIRGLINRTRGLSTPESLRLWATEQVRLHPRIACRPTDLSTKLI